MNCEVLYTYIYIHHLFALNKTSLIEVIKYMDMRYYGFMQWHIK